MKHPTQSQDPLDLNLLSTRGQPVDMETTREFMELTLEKITTDELNAIAQELWTKSFYFQELVHPDMLPALSDGQLQQLLRAVFATRRRAKHILAEVGPEELKTAIHHLLYQPSPIEARFQGFVDSMTGYFEDIRILRPRKSSDSRAKQSAEEAALKENIFCDLGSELLHFTAPNKYWLWTRWIWDPKAGTGAMPLVTMEGVDLFGVTVGETYIKLGGATKFIQATGEAAGFPGLMNRPFGIDVFLACVYVVYMYTTLRLRMTQEFNKVIPPMPELIRRLLGVWKLEI